MSQSEYQARPENARRFQFIDLLRAVAAQLVVLHHLVYYGPISDPVYPLVPRLFNLFYVDGRNAVQVFFVLSGFFVAASFGTMVQGSLEEAFRLVWKRAVRIGGPYAILLAIAAVANLIADRWMDNEAISPFPTLPQFLAHLVFLQDLLGYEALSAGIWYLAIDFQLLLLMALVHWLAHRLSHGTGYQPILFLESIFWPLVLSSAFYFNRDEVWESWGCYFLASYGVGVFLNWSNTKQIANWRYALVLVFLTVSLYLDFRWRLGTAVVVGGLLFFALRHPRLMNWPSLSFISWLGKSSYSLFLIHFPVLIIAYAILSHYVMRSPLLCLMGMVSTYLLCNLAALPFFRFIEQPLGRSRVLSERLKKLSQET
jgi:peptidoglycan/LPS O-acetylase OafA/YrhL